MNTTRLAERFVVVAKECNPALDQFSPSQKQVILDVVKYLGADISELKNRNELHPSVIGFRFLLLQPSGKQDEILTGWVTGALNRTRNSPFVGNQLTKETARLIEWARRMDPIRITEDGEQLQESDRELWLTAGRVVDPMSNAESPEDQMLPSSIGIHRVCTGKMHRRNVTSKAYVIYCEDCCLRVVVPNTVTTYRELRKHFEEQFRALPDK